MSESLYTTVDPLETVNAMMTERCDAAHCRGMIKTGSRSFYLASLFLPQPLRQATYALYAFCREADDAIDDGADPFAALAVFQGRLEHIYSNEVPVSAVDRALARVVRQYAMPREVLEALLQGFAWDAQERSYKDLPGVHRYSVRVAGSVGIAMALLMGVRDPQLLARAADLGVAMQLTNIARDVGEDARNGRIYLPLRWLRDAGLAPAELIANPQFQPALGDVVKRLLSAAELLYRRADSGIAGLPARCRPGIHAARLLYSAIGDEVLRHGGDSVSRRAVVPKWRKLQLLLRSRAAPAVDSSDLAAEPLPQVRYLLRAVDALPVTDRNALSTQSGKKDVGWRRDVHWVLDIFEELDRRERDVHGAGKAPRVKESARAELARAESAPAFSASEASERAAESAPRVAQNA